MSLRYLLYNQLRAIQQAGYEVTTISSPGPDVEFMQAAGIRHLAVPMTRRITPLADLWALWLLYRLIRRERFTIVHTHNPKPGLLGQLAARMAGVPIIVNTIHGFYFTLSTRPVTRTLYILLEKIAAHCSTLIFSQNREDMVTAMREGICPPERMKYLGNGIDLSWFDPGRITPALLTQKRAELGLTPETPVVGFVGRLVTEKGIRELLQAAKMVVESRPETRFLLIGPSDFDKADALTPAVAEQYGVAPACIFTGLRHDLPELYALMNLFVLPSHREGLPRAPMEASAMAIPCVVTDIRGCREVVQHGKNGLLVPLGNIPAMAEAILYLLDHPQEAQRLGDSGRDIARAQFDEQLVFQRTLTQYQQLLQKIGYNAPLFGGQNG